MNAPPPYTPPANGHELIPSRLSLVMRIKRRCERISHSFRALHVFRSGKRKIPGKVQKVTDRKSHLGVALRTLRNFQFKKQEKRRKPFLLFPNPVGEGAKGAKPQHTFSKPGKRVQLSSCSSKIRQNFIRKVYCILFAKVAATCFVSATIICSPSVLSWINVHDWVFYGCLFGALTSTAALIAYQHVFPANYIFLAAFIVMEAVTLGVKLAALPEAIVLQALIITTGVLLGLTLFTFRSKSDISIGGSYLYAGLVSLVMTGIVRSCVPFGSFENTIHALGGSVLFSGFIIYDTHQLIDELAPDEFIWASLRLYLDFISLFIYILRLLMEAEKNKKETEETKKKEEEERKKGKESEKKDGGKSKKKPASR